LFYKNASVKIKTRTKTTEMALGVTASAGQQLEHQLLGLSVGSPKTQVMNPLRLPDKIY
jgi:hypothetical protein